MRITKSARADLFHAALGVLEKRLEVAGAPAKRGGRRRPDHVLLESLTIGQVRTALDQMSRGAGGELRLSKGGAQAFCSAESSAAIAVNTFAAFNGRSFSDHSLGEVLSDPVFERTFRIKGVRAPVPPTLDVVFRGRDSATMIESKLLEPWRSEPKVSLSTQYDQPAAAISPRTLETLTELRTGSLRYGALDAAQLLKHLFGIQSAIKRGELPSNCSLVLLFWEPKRAGRHKPLFAALRSELQDFARRLDDQRVAMRALSYTQLWRDWQRAERPAWLRQHAQELQFRYGVVL